MAFMYYSSVLPYHRIPNILVTGHFAIEYEEFNKDNEEATRI